MFSGTITGNVGKDAELKYIASGKPVLNFSVASTEKAKGGDTTTWVNVAFWGERAEAVASYVTKGKQVSVYGKIRNRAYDKDGETRYSLELTADDIQLLGGGKEAAEVATVATKVKKTVDVSTAEAPF